MDDSNPLIEEILDSSEKVARKLLEEYQFSDSDISRDVLLKLKSGNHKAYDVLFKCYHASLKKYIAVIIKNVEDAQEITQEVFIKLWERREIIDPEKNIKGFLFNTARYFILDYFKHKRVQTKFHRYTATLFDLETAPDDQMVAKELDIIARITIERMPPQRQNVFRMRYEQAKSVEEISKELEIAVETVRSHLKIGKKEIKHIVTLYLFLLFVAQQGLAA